MLVQMRKRRWEQEQEQEQESKPESVVSVLDPYLLPPTQALQERGQRQRQQPTNQAEKPFQSQL